LFAVVDYAKLSILCQPRLALFCGDNAALAVGVCNVNHCFSFNWSDAWLDSSNIQQILSSLLPSPLQALD